ncbi:MAG: hypothetical protein EPO25_12470, partial [Gammaproteobacteria bacterium]
YSIMHTDPYRTIDGLSRTIGVQVRDVTQFVSAASDFSTKTMSASLEYGYPLTEFQGVRLGIVPQRSDLIVTETGSAREAVAWVRNNGKPYQRQLVTTGVDATGAPITYTTNVFGTKFDTIELVVGWYFDSRNRAIFADRGMRHSLSLSGAAPGSEVEYFVFNYEYLQLLPLGRRWTLAIGAEVGYGDAYGKSTTALPPYRQFFGGGPDSVRGFQESRLGPKDSFGNPYGGNLKVFGRAELVFPMPEKWRASARASLFFDVGNVFQQGSGVGFVGKDGTTPVDYGFDYNALKQSVGVAVQWMAPLGIFRFSYGYPLNAEAGDAVHYADEDERFQFTIGSAF